MTAPLRNWAGNVTFRAARVAAPRSVEELQELVAGSARLRALGTAHSFNTIADTTGTLVSVRDLPRRVDVAEDRRSVTVAGGLRYGDVVAELHDQGLALHNLGSLPHISIAGAVATGTHGSGIGNGSLSSAVLGLELVTPSGELLSLTREDGDRFAAAVVGLGCLGVVTAVTLAVEPTYDVVQQVYDAMPLAQARADLDAVLGAAYSVSLFTTWRGPVIDAVWVKQRAGERLPAGAAGERWHGAVLADSARHPIPGVDPVHCTEQLGVAGAWHERLPHFRLEFTPSSGEELQTEFFVDRAHGLDALAAVDALRGRVAPVLQISEIRTIAGDDLWLSPAFGRDSLGLHFTWAPDPAAVAPIVEALQEALAPYAARPHWGKVFTTAPDVVRGLYPRSEDFRRLRGELDPTGKLGNELVDRYLPAL